MVKVSCALVSARLALSQTLDDRESAFSFPLSATRCLFGCGVISSTEVTGEAVLVTSRTKVTGVTKVPFSMTGTTLFPRLERCSFFLALILAYISWFILMFCFYRKITHTYYFLRERRVFGPWRKICCSSMHMHIVLPENFNSQFIGHNIHLLFFIFFVLHLFFKYIVTIIFENLWHTIHNDCFIMSSQDTTWFLFWVDIIRTQVHYLKT